MLISIVLLDYFLIRIMKKGSKYCLLAGLNTECWYTGKGWD